MTKKKISTILLAIVLAISAIALSACNQVPEEYKIKNFYGTYNQFAEDSYPVLIYHKDEDVEKFVSKRWDIVSIDGDSFVYKDPVTRENVEGTDDPILLSEVKRLMERIGTSVTVDKKKIVMNDSNISIAYKRTVYYDNVTIENRLLSLYNKTNEIGVCRYMKMGDDNYVGVFGVFQTSEIVDENGVKFNITVTKYFIK